MVVETLNRSELVAVQTPQAFNAAKLRDAHLAGGDATDDAGLIEAIGGTVMVVQGDALNQKITEGNLANLDVRLLKLSSGHSVLVVRGVASEPLDVINSDI